MIRKLYCYFPLIPLIALFTGKTEAQVREYPVSFTQFEKLSVGEISSLTGYSADSAELVLQTLENIRSWVDKRTFSGDVNFGFFGSTTRDGTDNLFNIYGGFKLDWEMYPGNLDFSTLFGITYNDNELQQNLSQVDVSYDHLHKNVGNGMLLENYVYVNRSTNAYLGIDQRYEIGGGIILNNWVKSLISPADESFPIPYKGDPDGGWEDWVGELDGEYGAKEKQAFRDLYQEGYVKNRMKNSKLRTALLAGLYFELEQTTVRDSITLPVTNKFRWALRPTLDIKLNDGWSFKMRTYFKMPAPWNWYDDVVSPDGSAVSRKADYYITTNASVTSKLMNERIEVSFVYQQAFDNTPARTFYERNDGSYMLIVNNDLNQSFRVALKISLVPQ